MKPEVVSILCRPGTHEPLRLDTRPGPDGAAQPVLVGTQTGDVFPIRDGIPILLDEAKVSGFNKQYQGFYNRIAGVYDAAIRFAGILAGGEEGSRKEYLAELDLRQGDRLLEVSIGTGANLRYCPAPVAYFGVDLSWGMLMRCRSNMRRWGLDAELILGNAEDLPLRDESFDAVLHVGGINAFNDRGRAIREMVRVARPGTKIVIVDETVHLMESLAWIPSVRRWLRENRDKFLAPTSLVPSGMKDVQAKDIVKGNLYCLTFRKP